MNKPISVVVVDDHPLFRRGVVELLNDSPNMVVTAEFDNALSFIENSDELNPDLLLLDLQMPDKSGIEVLKQVRQANKDYKIIILTACSEQNKMLDALRYGANGYLQKDTPPDAILEQLSSVLSGQIALNPDAVTALANQLREAHTEEESESILSDMTEREQETLFLIAQGLNNKLIARELGISDGTVKVYVKSLLRKLNLHSRLELAAWTHQNLSDHIENKV